MVRGEREGWGWGLRLRRGQRLASCRFLEGHLSWIRCGWIVGFWVGIFSDFFSLNRRGEVRQGKGREGGIYDLHNLFQDTHDER